MKASLYCLMWKRVPLTPKFVVVDFQIDAYWHEEALQIWRRTQL